MNKGERTRIIEEFRAWAKPQLEAGTLTQEQIGEYLGADQSNVSKWMTSVVPGTLWAQRIQNMLMQVRNAPGGIAVRESSAEHGSERKRPAHVEEILALLDRETRTAELEAEAARIRAAAERHRATVLERLSALLSGLESSSDREEEAAIDRAATVVARDEGEGNGGPTEPASREIDKPSPNAQDPGSQGRKPRRSDP